MAETDMPGRPGDSDDTDLERTPARSQDDEDYVDLTAGSEATEQVEITNSNLHLGGGAGAAGSNEAGVYPTAAQSPATTQDSGAALHGSAGERPAGRRRRRVLIFFPIVTASSPSSWSWC